MLRFLGSILFFCLCFLPAVVLARDNVRVADTPITKLSPSPTLLLSARQAVSRFQLSGLPAHESADYITALQDYRRFLGGLGEEPDTPAYFPALLEFAALLESQDRWHDAAIYFGRAARYLARVQSTDWALRAAMSARLAYVHWFGQVMALAVDHAKEALDYCAKLSSESTACMMLPKRVLADVYFRMGDFRKAAELYQILADVDPSKYQAQVVLVSQDYFRLRYWLAKLKMKSLSETQIRNALSALDLSLAGRHCDGKIEQDVCRELRNGTVELAIALGDWQAAQWRSDVALAQRAKVVVITKHPSREWVVAAQVQLARGDLAKARISLIQALADYGDSFPERSVKFKTLAQYYRQTGQTNAEIFFLKRASVWALYGARHLRLYDAQAGRVFLAGYTDIFRRLSSLLFEQNRLIEALDVLDLYKENLFLDYSGELPNAMRSAAHTAHGMTWKNRYYADVGQVVDLIGKGEWSHLYQIDLPDSGGGVKIAPTTPSQENWNQSVAIFTQFLDQLEQDFRQDHAVVPDEESVQVFEQKHAMIKHPRAALVEYLFNEDTLYIALLTHDKAIKSFKIAVPQQRLTELLYVHQQAILSRRDTRPVARQLYQLLIGSIQPTLLQQGIKELVFFPDPVLQSLPFAALHNGKRYLVEDYAIQIVNQTEQIERAEAPSKAIASLFGNAQPSEALPELPAVRGEIKALQAELKRKGMVTEVFLDKAFDLTEFEAAVRDRHQILHLATHYKHHAQKPDESYFLTGQNTALSLDKIKALTQDYSFAEMISLSACDTDVSAQTDGGMNAEGLGSILLRRGAKAVLATKWPVHDDGSAQLMPRFYGAWLSGQSKAQALQSAQLALLKFRLKPHHSNHSRGLSLANRSRYAMKQDPRFPYAHPYFWAGFVLLER